MSITLAQWIKTPSAIKHAQRLQSTETFKEMMNVMEEEKPLNRTGLPFGALPTDYAYALGMQKGYDHALKVLKAMGQTAPEPPEEIEATFSKDNYDNGQ